MQRLQPMDSFYVNEHIINLLLEVRGNLQTDKAQMLSVIERFLQAAQNALLPNRIWRKRYPGVGCDVPMGSELFLLDDLKKPDLHQQAEESMQKILKENPKIDFTVLCNYVRQSQI